jgi:hypothetical protein
MSVKQKKEFASDYANATVMPEKQDSEAFAAVGFFYPNKLNLNSKYLCMSDGGTTLRVMNNRVFFTPSSTQVVPTSTADTAGGPLKLNELGYVDFLEANCFLNENLTWSTLSETWLQYNFDFSEEKIPESVRRPPRWKKITLESGEEIIFYYVERPSRKPGDLSGVYLADLEPFVVGKNPLFAIPEPGDLPVSKKTLIDLSPM